MASQVNPPRGMRDFLPEEKRARDAVLAKIRATYAAHGFQEIETPALEDLGRLTSGQGGDNEKLAYRVMKRGEELESAIAAGSELADLGLRYDLTVPLTRFYATNRASLPSVFKAIQTGPVWRAERPQKGRYRQFVQCDIDIIGDATEMAEVDLLSASISALDGLGLSDAVIRVNHRELLVRLLDSLGVSTSDHGSAMITIDKLDKVGADGVAAELASRFGASVGSAFSTWISALDVSVIPSELSSLFAILPSGRLKYDPTLVRGMGYYTGPIFEIEHPGSGSSIGGGGRYDGMVGRWLGTDVPAVGISLGFERVMDLVTVPADSSEGVVLVLEGDVLAKAVEIRAALIAQGYRVRFEDRPKKLGNLLESLAGQGFTKFAILDTTTTELELRPIA